MPKAQKSGPKLLLPVCGMSVSQPTDIHHVVLELSRKENMLKRARPVVQRHGLSADQPPSLQRALPQGHPAVIGRYCPAPLPIVRCFASKEAAAKPVIPLVATQLQTADNIAVMQACHFPRYALGSQLVAG